MIRTRHRFLAVLASVVALGVAGSACASSLVELDYNAAKVLGTVDVGGTGSTTGVIDITNGAMIVTTSSFGFIPAGYNNGGTQTKYPTEIGSLGIPEFGDPAIHDALVEGANYKAGGYWNGTNGIMSSLAASDTSLNTAVGWVDNSVTKYTSFWGQPVNQSQSIIADTYYGDANLDGKVDLTFDYPAWSGTFGSNTGAIPGEINWFDGDWEQKGVADLTFNYPAWSGAFGSNLPVLPFNPTLAPVVPGGSVGSVSTVPEPGSLALALSAALCGIGCLRLRASRQ